MNTLHNISSPPGTHDPIPETHHINPFRLAINMKDRIEHLSYPKTFALILLTSWLLSRTAKWLTNGKQKKLTVPVFGYRSWFEPTFLLQTRFVRGARELIHEAYTKMPNMPFVLKRYDADFLILPIRYLDELRLIPLSKLSNKGANVANLVPEYHGITFLLTNNLHVDVLRKKLTPELWKFIDSASTELSHGWDISLPLRDLATNGNEWVKIDFERTVRDLVARMTAKVFLGDPACRDETWLGISVDFSIDLFTASFTMKMFPPWMYPVVAPLIPARRRVLKQLSAAQRIVGAQMAKHDSLKEKRAQAAARGEVALTEEEEEKAQDTLLDWMLDHGKGSEVQVEEMSARQCVLTLASIHTTASQTANMMFDLCEHPQWWGVLREEVDSIAKELGPPGMAGKTGGVSVKEWCVRLEKMDSFFQETQRREPPILLGPQRLALSSLTLKDGTFIPRGTRVAFPMLEHQNDPLTYSNPHEYDPLRFYRKRHSCPDQMNLHMAGQTHPNVLGFGYGNQACPGRQFAVAEIKLIMARMVYEFEFKFANPEKGRPKTGYVNEMAMTDWGARLLMRRRVRSD
ncbi:cytochrome P450 [Pseudoneurospora amorphoporcata]|uniref:Cytochrome P450 n=1 Tax=Pseudoneurospora amorphoporcata TaxID=241081 RepID=A0AAN6NST9_9PEZI|nr:cytochrome P450 [Pseudoneurospora amorphoporcata]